MGFFQGDIRLLPDDMKTLKPTVFPAVPRLLNRVYDKVPLYFLLSQPQAEGTTWLLSAVYQSKFAPLPLSPLYQYRFPVTFTNALMKNHN